MNMNGIGKIDIVLMDIDNNPRSNKNVNYIFFSDKNTRYR